MHNLVMNNADGTTSGIGRFPAIEGLRAHVIAHALMLHGAIPDEILPGSTTMFLPPAWSLSLEWQFYLVAPIVVATLRKGGAAALGIIVVSWACFYLFVHNKFGTFSIGGFLLGAAPLFLVGIATRLAMPFPAIGRPILLAAGAVALMPIASPMAVAVLLWVAFCAFLCAEHQPLTGIDGVGMRLFRAAFTNRVVLFWGERSYSVYLMHLPTLAVVAYVVARPWMSHGTFFLALTIGGILLTGAISLLTYSIVEWPGIVLGRMLVAACSSHKQARRQIA